MKKVISFIILIIILILVMVLLRISNNKAKANEILKFNSQFEIYLKKTLYGADVVTLINKAIDNNNDERYDIEKDENGFYIEDDIYSVEVELILLSKNEEGKIEKKAYKMETLENAGLTGFISNFGLTTFECTKIEYNHNNRVSKVIVKQLEL